MTIKFLRDWNGHRPGEVIDTIPASSCELLIRRKLAVAVKVVQSPPRNKSLQPAAVISKGTRR